MNGFLTVLLRSFLVGGLMFFAIFGSTAAFAQTQQCAPYPDLTAHLISQFGETMVWHGDATPQVVVQLWSNAETQTWTVVAYRADGMGCFMASGTGFETFARPPAGTEG
jgi:hypothetical protein